ncbi:MAG: hypothetical protein ABSH28_17975 [Acidobacteriota bacterium]|jgi:hypothetical protein
MICSIRIHLSYIRPLAPLAALILASLLTTSCTKARSQLSAMTPITKAESDSPEDRIQNRGSSSLKSAVATVPAQAFPRETPAPPCWIVYGIDISGSFHSINNAFAQAAKQVEHHAQPGDVWLFRLINNQSYADEASVLVLRCPPPIEDSPNPFDRLAKQRKQAADQEMARLRAAAAQFLLRYQTKASLRTDIYGFLAKAGELLAAAPPGTRKILIIDSDLEDNVAQNPAINLRGVRVTVGWFQGSAQGKATQDLRLSWETKFRKYGATDVMFVDASQAMLENLAFR